MSGIAATWIWLLDRGTGLVTLPALWLAVVTGIFYRTRRPAIFHGIAQRHHLSISAFALVITSMHAIVGILDTVMLGAGLAPAPNYPLWFFYGGAVVGVLAFATLLLAVASFLAPWRFDHPSLVHALAYVGFVFGIAHAVAIGTDVVGLTENLVFVSLVLVAWALALKLFVGIGAGVRSIAGI